MTWTVSEGVTRIVCKLPSEATRIGRENSLSSMEKSNNETTNQTKILDKMLCHEEHYTWTQCTVRIARYDKEMNRLGKKATDR